MQVHVTPEELGEFALKIDELEKADPRMGANAISTSMSLSGPKSSRGTEPKKESGAAETMPVWATSLARALGLRHCAPSAAVLRVEKCLYWRGCMGGASRATARLATQSLTHPQHRATDV